jgi:hypothetical protein
MISLQGLSVTRGIWLSAGVRRERAGDPDPGRSGRRSSITASGSWVVLEDPEGNEFLQMSKRIPADLARFHDAWLRAYSPWTPVHSTRHERTLARRGCRDFA